MPGRFFKRLKAKTTTSTKDIALHARYPTHRDKTAMNGAPAVWVTLAAWG